MAHTSEFIASARQVLEGELFSDDLRRGVYATDASIYQIRPQCVIFPRHEGDLMHIVRLAAAHDIPLLPRGGGTSLAGQAVGDAAVLDFTKYMHSVKAYDPEQRHILVEPGITRDEVNAVAAADGLYFAPDPATSSRAAIGGMIANNSSGTKSILYGKTIDHVLGLKVLLANGDILCWGDIDKAGAADDGPYRESLKQLLDKHAGRIRETYPKTMRRVAGYCLDELLDDQSADPFKIFLGSEGTLGIILQAKLRLVPLPKFKSVAVVQFADGMEAVRAVEPMLAFKPVAVEILSDRVLQYSRKNIATRDKCQFIAGDPAAIQIVEFHDEDAQKVMDRPAAMVADLKARGLGYAWSIFPEGHTYDDVWDIRKKGLGLLMGEPTDKRGIAFIEDAAIPISVLPGYIEQVLEICEHHGVEATYYAHASVGVIHVRPLLDLRVAGDIDKMREIANDVFKLVMLYGGAWSGEHGDGLVRSGFLKSYFGKELYAAFQQVKELFDPQHLMNPGKIIDPPPMTDNLRYGADYHDNKFAAIFHYREQKNFHTAVHQCTGIGACRKMQGGTMCPSYMVTRDEMHSTRGRANALRLAMSGQMSKLWLADPTLKEALDLCISCKACKAECPSSVDMARLKSEVLHHQYQTHGVTLRDRLIAGSTEAARKVSGWRAPLVNALLNTSAFRWTVEKIAGFDRRRTLPPFVRHTFKHWFEHEPRPPEGGEKVILFADTYTCYHEPVIGIAAVQLLRALGCDVTIAGGCCQRPRISHGYLEKAMEEGEELFRRLDTGEDTPILVCEPGCASALTDDLPDLVDDEELARRITRRVIPIEQWLQGKTEQNLTAKLTPSAKEIFLHGHCHQKALYGTTAIHHIFNMLGATIYEPDSGCCGMAGSFGYEKEHYEISQQMGERVLFKELRERPDMLVVAAGFSCRHQIEHFTGRTVKHWLNAIELK